MLQIYGSPLSSPTNKVRYVANYLQILFEFHSVNLPRGDHRKEEFLKINPFGRIPAMNDDGFCLGESNAIIRYLSDKCNSLLYPKELKKRAIVDQWIDYSSQHVMTALARIMFNMHFYKLTSASIDERSLEDGRKFIGQYLPVLEKQLSQSSFIAGRELSLADLALLASLDTCEVAGVDLTSYPSLTVWRSALIKQEFYQACHRSYAETFERIMAGIKERV